MANRPTNKASEVWKFVGYFLVLVAAIYGFPLFVESLVVKKLESHETIEKISRLVRPSVIFDNKGVILADLGGLEYVKSFKLSYKDKAQEVPTKVEVKGKKFLALPPLLISLGNYYYIDKPTRGKELSWVYELEPIRYISDAGSISFVREVGGIRFRLEILR